jgi:hypothetical protein
LLELLQNAFLNIKSPAILFFILGFFASIIKSDLKIPESIAKILSIYLMMAIGFKGGIEIEKSGASPELFSAVGITLAVGVLIPLLSFVILKKINKLDTINAGAIAAHYGSVSVITFVTASTFLDRELIAHDGFMVGMMALMESPAIFVSLLLVAYLAKKQTASAEFNIKEVVRESLFNGSVVLLFGSMIVGYLTGKDGYETTKPFFVSPFQGILTLFLLEMGLLAGKRIDEFKEVGISLGLFGILMPIFNGILGAVLASSIGLSVGSTTLFAVLTASASYIAAPAAVRLALPTANPSYYITMSLAITFPFNIVFGIPLYYSIANFLQ